MAQFAPAFFGGLVWRNATARGAIAGIVTGFAVWAYTLLLPWIIEAGWVPRSILIEGPFGLGFLSPKALVLPAARPAHPRRAVEHGRQRAGVRRRVAAEGARAGRAPAGAGVRAGRPAAPADVARRSGCGARPSPPATCSTRLPAISVPSARSARSPSMRRAATRRSAPDAEADIHLLRFTEHLLASAIGAASSRLVLSLLLRRRDAGSQSALRLLDDASEALQYNRDLLQSALDQVRHGLSVFDKDMRLICWNRQFRELLNLPPELGRVGAPLDQILRTCAERGDFGDGDIDKLAADRLMKLARGARDVPGALRRRQAHPRDPHQPDAAGRHRHHLFRHHRARRGRRGAGARQRDAGAPRAGAHGRAHRGQPGAGGRQAQGRRGQPRQDALPGGGQPRRAAAAQCGAALRDEPGRALARRAGGDARAQHRRLAGGGRGDPRRADRDLAARHRQARARHHRLPPATRCSSGWRWSSRRWRARRGSSCASCRRAPGCARTGGCCAACCRTSLSNAIKYTTTGKVLLGVRRRGDRLARPGLRYRPRHPQIEAHAHLQGVPAAGGDGERGAGAWASACRSSSASARCSAIAIGLHSAPGRGSTFSVELPRAEPSARREPGAVDDAVGRTHRGADRAVHRQRARRCCAACRRCSRAGAAPSSPPRARPKRSRSCARAAPRPTSSSPTTISTKAPAWRRWRPCAPRRGVAGPGHRHHRGSLRRGAARGAPARLRPAAQAAQGGGAARADVPAHLAARGGGGVVRCQK